MKKLKMIVTSVVVLAIVGSAFAFNTKKFGVFCLSGDINSTSCNTVNTTPLKRVSGINNRYYIVDWDGSSGTCNGATCTTSAHFELD